MARILLADDDAASRDLVSRALTSDGHTVDSTQDGAEALEHLRAPGAAFDLLVTDVHMPGLDGVALVERVLAAHGSVRVVLMSGYTSELERAQRLAPGKLTVVSKPFTLEQMRAAVRVALA